MIKQIGCSYGMALMYCLMYSTVSLPLWLLSATVISTFLAHFPFPLFEKELLAYTSILIIGTLAARFKLIEFLLTMLSPLESLIRLTNSSSIAPLPYFLRAFIEFGINRMSTSQCFSHKPVANEPQIAIFMSSFSNRSLSYYKKGAIYLFAIQ